MLSFADIKPFAKIGKNCNLAFIVLKTKQLAYIHTALNLYCHLICIFDKIFSLAAHQKDAGYITP